MASYNDMARTVLDYYTNPSDLVQYGGWENIFTPGNEYNLEQAYNAIRNNPDIQIIERTDGTVVGWWNKSTGSGNLTTGIGSLPNSNTAGGTAQSSALANIQTSPSVTETSSGSFTFANSPKAGERWITNGGIAPAIAVAATGLSLGVTIDKALYAAKPGFLTDEQLETLNPDNWKQISNLVDEQWTEMGYPTIGKIGRRVFDTILGINSTDNSTQMYIDEDAYAYSAWYLQHQNIFTASNIITPKPTASLHYNYTQPIYVTKHLDVIQTYKGETRRQTVDVYSGDAYICLVEIYGHYMQIEVGGKGTFSFTVDFHGTQSNWDLTDKDTAAFWKSPYPSPDSGEYSLAPTVCTNDDVSISYVNLDFIEILVNGTTSSSYTEGIDSQSGATLPDLSTATDLESFKTLLKQQYPDVWTNSVTKQVLQPDGTLKTFTYVPVPTPNATDWMDTEPTGDGSQQSQKDTVVNPDMDDSIKDTISSSGSTGTTTPNPPDTGDGDSPTVIPPVGKASSLWSIYNPTLEQVNQFGSWLWSSDFVEQLKKLFSDPMQAIIGLHKIYSPVQTSGVGTIKCGYLNSEVPSKLVSEQYVTVDCGSVDLQEYFGNVFDYPPYTEVSIYLPFIGVRQLDPSDVMRSTISVKYHVDVLTGACLAEVNVQRDAAGGTLYTFSGDAAVRYPVSSGSYMGIVSGLIGVATSVVSGNLLPALGGATRLHTNVERSGSFTGNSGAMGSKVPYLIISRPQTAMADKFETLSGYPSNTYTPLSACKGFTQVNYCHVENLSATETEKNEIERLLKEGVIL